MRQSIHFRWIEKRSSYIGSFPMKPSKKTMWNWNLKHCDFVLSGYERNLSNIIEKKTLETIQFKTKRSQCRKIFFLFCLTCNRAVGSSHNQFITMMWCKSCTSSHRIFQFVVYEEHIVSRLLLLIDRPLSSFSQWLIDSLWKRSLRIRWLLTDSDSFLTHVS